ncbi:MAG: DUF362 domain-containing protein [Bacteroidales bacterium]|nr:DUF362 domain-containing protein [Bacteroidales bacterium]
MNSTTIFTQNRDNKRLAEGLKKPGILFKILFIITGIASLIWFLIRVIPKPGRATYPCMKATAPIASSFVIYLLSLAGSVVFFRKAMNKIRTRQFRYAASVFMIVAALGTLTLMNNTTNAKAYSPVTEKFSDPLGPNAPIGEAKGIFPGRVVWVYNENATNENCTNEDNDDAYWLSKNCSQTLVDQMFSDGILTLTGEDTHADAWDAIFRYFNNNHEKGDVGYDDSETVFIKINAVTAHGGAPVSGDFWGDIQYDTSPQTILSILRQLVNEAGVPQANIYVGDPMCDIYNHIYDVLHGEFPNVRYVTSWGLNNRYDLTPSSEAGITYSDGGTVITELNSHKLYVEMMEADYILNIPTMKGHRWAGTTFFAKNHFGSNTSGYSGALHKGLMKPSEHEPLREGYNLYRVLVDIMGSQYMGGKTLLYFMDALWATSYEHQKPQKFLSNPWNNDWCSSLLFSLDPVAIESVCLDILQKEFTLNNSDENGDDGDTSPYRWSFVQWDGVDDYLHQAASSEWWPDGITYDPDQTGSPIPSLGVHEHWNDTTNMQYSRNLGTGDGIELVKIWEEINSFRDAGVSGRFSVFPNPCLDEVNICFELQDADLNIEIFTANGQKVFEQDYGSMSAGQNEISLDVGYLNSGLYFVTVHTGNNNRKTYTQRLVVQ